MSKIHQYIYHSANPNEITIELEQSELLPPVAVVQSVHFPEKEITNELDLIERKNIVPIEEIIIPSHSVYLDKSINEIIQPILPNTIEEVTIYPSEEYDSGLGIVPSIEEVQTDNPSHSEDLPEINDPAPVDEVQTQVLEGDRSSTTTGWTNIFNGLFNIFKNYTTKKEATEEISKILNEKKIDADPDKLYEALEQSKHLPPEEIEPSVIKLLGDIAPETQTAEGNKTHSYCEIM